MFVHSRLITKETHRAHGFDFSIWVFSSDESTEYTSFISRLPGTAGDPVGIQTITASDDFGAENLIVLSKREIDENIEGIYSA